MGLFVFFYRHSRGKCYRNCQIEFLHSDFAQPDLELANFYLFTWNWAGLMIPQQHSALQQLTSCLRVSNRKELESIFTLLVNERTKRAKKKCILIYSASHSFALKVLLAKKKLRVELSLSMNWQRAPSTCVSFHHRKILKRRVNWNERKKFADDVRWARCDIESHIQQHLRGHSNIIVVQTTPPRSSW